MGHFIDPDPSLEGHSSPHEALGLPIYSGYRAINESHGFKGQFRIFDEIIEGASAFEVPYEDQCSADYYFDIVRTLRDLNGEYDRVVEVGVFMGGASVMLAGCSDRFDFDLDLVDIDANFLRFTYERIRRCFPEATGRIRLFHGDLPSYVKEVMLADGVDKHGGRSLIHHDGAHDFNQVVKDLSAISFVRDQVHSIIAQDTHLRGTLTEMNFVDMALSAVFGTGLTFVPIGKVYHEADSRTNPNEYQGNYFRPGISEGMIVPMAANRFHYPHPQATFEEMFAAA
ncbi:MAG: class I SAM-dependent methyltransferase [Pseudomonadota bacterium]